MAITRALEDAPQQGLMSRTVNTATRIPQEAIERRQNSKTIGRQTVQPTISAGSVNSLQSQSGNMLSNFSTPGGKVAMPNYNDMRDQAIRERHSALGINPRTATYGDWARYFAAKGPSSQWDDNTWQMFAYLSYKNAKDAGRAMNGSKDPYAVDLAHVGRYFDLAGTTMSPLGEYAYNIMQRALAPWYANQLIAWKAEPGPYKPYKYGVAPTHLTSYYGYGDSQDKFNQIAGSTTKGKQLVEMKPYLDRYLSNDPYGIVVNGLTDAAKSLENIVPWVGAYATEPSPAAALEGARSSGSGGDPFGISSQRRLMGRRSIQ